MQQSIEPSSDQLSIPYDQPQNVESRLRSRRAQTQSYVDQEDYEAEQELDVVRQDQIYGNNGKKKKSQAVVRKPHRSRSQVQTNSLPTGPKTKRKYDKKQNEGNILLQEARSSSILKQICNPDGYVTVDSLGHALQKMHIDFSLRDIADMISLYWRLKREQVPEDQEDRVAEDQNGDINLSLKLNPNQFKELYTAIRKKK